LVETIVEERKVANKIEDASKQAKQYCEKIFPFFEQIRYEVDKLELIVDDELWPLPKYRELLFAK
jgi:glutamine synthetase